MGTLATLRGHPYDSFRNTREAIEAAAFALRFKEHPHLSRLWRRSVESDERYEKYKNAFGAKKLLPGSSELTRDLKGRYDLCAKLSHPSFLASAHSFKTARAGTRQGLIYPFFHGKKGARGAQRQALLWLLDTHFLTIKLLETALPEVVEKGGPVWQLHVNGVDGSLIHQKSLFKADPDRASSGKRKTEGIILFPAIG